ncbi:hypothetical protein TURU_013327 [Turdus rufiventris]|nr:hypothetical protein TURU_013327 [Turdus rufiventris]
MSHEEQLMELEVFSLEKRSSGGTFSLSTAPQQEGGVRCLSLALAGCSCGHSQILLLKLQGDLSAAFKVPKGTTEVLEMDFGQGPGLCDTLQTEQPDNDANDNSSFGMTCIQLFLTKPLLSVTAQRINIQLNMVKYSLSDQLS